MNRPTDPFPWEEPDGTRWNINRMPTWETRYRPRDMSVPQPDVLCLTADPVEARLKAGPYRYGQETTKGHVNG